MAVRSASTAAGRPGRHLVIFLHGSGDTGAGVEQWVRAVGPALLQQWARQQVETVFPTAPERPYSLFEGTWTNVWFDRRELSYDMDAREEEHSWENGLEESLQTLDAMLERNGDGGKVVLGGFSMGACLALHALERFPERLAGVFAFSTFLGMNSRVINSLRGMSARGVPLPPVLMVHGQNDGLVPCSWGEETSKRLQKAGVQVQWHTVPGMDHELCEWEMELLQEFTAPFFQGDSGGDDAKGGAGGTAAHAGPASGAAGAAGAGASAKADDSEDAADTRAAADASEMEERVNAELGPPSSISRRARAAAEAAAASEAADVAEGKEGSGGGGGGGGERDDPHVSENGLVRYEIVERSEDINMVRVRFTVPEGTAPLLERFPVQARQCWFEMKAVSSNVVESTFESPRPDATAEALLAALERRVIDPDALSAKEVCTIQ